MSIRDRLPSFESGGKTIEIVEPDARTITSNVVIFIALFGVFGLGLISIGLLPQDSYVWIPLGVITFLMAVNPIVRLNGIWEAIAIILMYVNLLAFMIIYYQDQLTNALLISITLLMIVVIFEYPRRFNLK